MSTLRDTYRNSHTAPGYGDRYNSNYARGYYAAQFRQIEIPLLTEIFSEYAEYNASCLDFACGTGRITQIASKYFSRVVAVDVSEAMLSHFSPLPNVEVKLHDITQGALSEQFDVITAFRFFLNAEDDLRISALRALRMHLRPNGELICNIHMNSYSPMGLLYSMLQFVTGRSIHNTMSLKSFQRILEAEGFVVETVIWYGYLPRPGRFCPTMMEKLAQPIETIARAMRFGPLLAQSFLIRARRAD